MTAVTDSTAAGLTATGSTETNSTAAGSTITLTKSKTPSVVHKFAVEPAVVVGSIALLVAVVLLLLYHRRRRQKWSRWRLTNAD